MDEEEERAEDSRWAELYEPPARRSARLFLGVPVPEALSPALQAALDHFPQYIERVVPPAVRHLTFVWIGEREFYTRYLTLMARPLPQAYVPAVTLTHVGRGGAHNQLWAYVQASPVLANLRLQLIARLKRIHMILPANVYRPFVPHIKLARLYRMAGRFALPEVPVSASFIIREIHLYRSETTPSGPNYVIERTIPLGGA